MGVVVDADLLDADAAALLALTASADGTACASVAAVSTGGDTSVGVTVTIEVCAEVTAITDGTITIGDVTFIFAGAADADIESGDELCFAAGTAPTGDPIITDIDTTDDDEGAAPATGDDDGVLLPDTANGPTATPTVLGWLLLLAAAIGFSAARRSGFSAR